MLITCPNCKEVSSIDPKGATDVKVRCASCRAVFRVRRKAVAPAEAAAAAEPAAAPLAATPAAGGGATELAKVVVANESPSFCETVQQLLAGEPFEVHVCHDGTQALAAVNALRPQLLLLDVALPGMFGFEVCERVRQNPELGGVRIILIPSIYDKTKYKRSPNSLYGADDYIEKHHIPDSLVPMIHRLCGSPVPEVTQPSVQELASQDQTRQELRQFEVRETSLPPKVELPEAERKAKRLARIIVSDIALYNQAKVEQGVRDGSFYTILADDIREGENLYRQRVPEGVRSRTAYLEEAFNALIEKKRAELGLAPA